MAGTAEDTKAVAEALAQVELEDTYVGKVKWGGEKSFGVARQGIYDCYTTTIDKGVARVEDIRFPRCRTTTDPEPSAATRPTAGPTRLGRPFPRSRSPGMSDVLQMGLTGLSLGLMYALIAIGLTLIFGVMRIIQYAHGEMFMLGAFTLYYWHAELGLPYWPGVAVSALLIFCVGAVLQVVLFRPLQGKNILYCWRSRWGWC
ncbi:MAG: hypothetical protein IPF96_21780 [Rhodobacter sp.]|nr:hypothetical protein [Rhodobacter sp.]